jgi:hypothetical protein
MSHVSRNAAIQDIREKIGNACICTQTTPADENDQSTNSDSNSCEKRDPFNLLIAFTQSRL